MANVGRRWTGTFLALLLIGCAPVAPPTSRPTTTTIAEGPPSPSAAPTGTEAPARSPSAGSEPTRITGAIVLSVDDIDPELGPRHPIPLLSIYQDGSVIEVVPDDSTNYGRAAFARLTMAGLAAVLDAAGGATRLDLDDPLGDHLSDLETWLPHTAWALAPSDLVTWIPADYLLAIRIHDAARELKPDVAAVWTLPVPVDGFGEPLDGDAPAAGDRALRCGVVSLDDAVEIQAGLGTSNAIGIPRELETWAELGWAGERAWIELVLEPLLPDEPRSCAMLWISP